MTSRILIGDCRERLREIPEANVDSCVTDPPYHLTSIVKRFGAANAAPAKSGKTGAYARASRGFMGQTWDGGDVAFDPDTWRAIFRVLKPGAHLVAFSGTRTYHRMVCAIEDAGFEIRDQIGWLYGSGFPKSHDAAQSIEKLLTTGKARRPDRDLGGLPRDRFSGSEQGTLIADTGGKVPLTTPEAEQWQGWGTALKPAWEPICLARKPLDGTVANNVLQHGTGALNIDGCRVEHGGDVNLSLVQRQQSSPVSGFNMASSKHGLDVPMYKPLGRWPANIIHDGSDEVLAGFPAEAGAAAPVHRRNGDKFRGTYGAFGGNIDEQGSTFHGDSGSAARFFYTAKADSDERHVGCGGLEKRNDHPTVKRLSLMRWLCTLVTPPGGTVLDPFMGSGSTLIAADQAQFNGIGCEMSAHYADIAERRLRAHGGLFAQIEVAA
jgi:site-specific DNA-methyltransferase (adenine-specific)